MFRSTSWKDFTDLFSKNNFKRNGKVLLDNFLSKI